MVTINCPIKCIKTITFTVTNQCTGLPVSFTGCTTTLTLKRDYADLTKIMTLEGTVSGDDDNILSFTTTVAGTTVTPGKYKGDIVVTNGSTIVNRDIKFDWVFDPIVSD